METVKVAASELVRLEAERDAFKLAAMAAAEFASTGDPDDGHRMFAALEAAGLKPIL